MKGRIGLLTLLSLLLSVAVGGQPWSQMRRPPTQEDLQRRAEEQRLKVARDQEEFRRRVEEQRLQQAERRRIAQEYEDEAHREALGATPEQWRAIKPRLEAVKALIVLPGLDISVYSFSATASYQGGSSAQTSGGAASSMSASGQSSATRSSDSQSRSFTRSGAGGTVTGHTQASGGGSAQVYGQAPGPVRKQVGDVNLGWQWQRPSLSKSPDELTASERACEQLLDVLEADAPDPDRLRRQVETLRRVREQKQHELHEARRQLREVVTPGQEAGLILMGYLD